MICLIIYTCEIKLGQYLGKHGKLSFTFKSLTNVYILFTHTHT